LRNAIAITIGEPAGIGPDIVIQAVQQSWPTELIILGNKNLLLSRAKLLNLPFPAHINIIDIPLKAPSKPGELNPENAAFVMQQLEIAKKMAQEKKVNAIVTAPVHKALLNTAGFAFQGHTEFFADGKLSMMLFVAQDKRIALATTHLPLKKVSEAITSSHLENILRLYHQDLIRLFGISHPKILVCGLNPHAGEDGYLGSEEKEIITPVITRLQQEQKDIRGPFSADTIFMKPADAILAMYHDQALPVVKQMSFGHAVNVTLGLPFIRTSVDHGTALDVAGTLKADPSSLKAAIELGRRLSSR